MKLRNDQGSLQMDGNYYIKSDVVMNRDTLHIDILTKLGKEASQRM